MGNKKSALQSSCTCEIRTDVATNVAVVITNVPMSIFAALCNSLILLTVIKTRSLQRPANLLICSLALGDFLVGSVVQPLDVSLRIMQSAGLNVCMFEALCEVHRLAVKLFVAGSFLQVCVLNWDRYQALSSPLKYRVTKTNKRTIALATISWCVWVVFVCTLHFALMRAGESPWMSIQAMAFIIIPTILQIGIFKAVRRQNLQIKCAHFGFTAILLAREKKLATSLRYVIATSFFCVLPTVILVVTKASGQNEVVSYLWPWARTAAYLNSSLNPLIYFWRHPNMRSATLKLISFF